MENFVVLPVEITQNEEDAEHALVEQAKTNSAAFGILYERYAMYVYHYLRTRVETDEDARDLTQQVFLKAFAALPRYRTLGIPFKESPRNGYQSTLEKAADLGTVTGSNACSLGAESRNPFARTRGPCASPTIALGSYYL